MGSIPSTRPDFYYEEQVNRIRIAIYIDGLSKNIHGNADRAKIDKFIEQALETFHQIKVVRIPATAKHDPKILDYFLQQIANFLKPNNSN